MRAPEMMYCRACLRSVPAATLVHVEGQHWCRDRGACDAARDAWVAQHVNAAPSDGKPPPGDAVRANVVRLARLLAVSRGEAIEADVVAAYEDQAAFLASHGVLAVSVDTVPRSWWIVNQETRPFGAHRARNILRRLEKTCPCGTPGAPQSHERRSGASRMASKRTSTEVAG